MRVASAAFVLISCSAPVGGCGYQSPRHWPMLAFVLRRDTGPPLTVVSPDYELGNRVSDEGVELGTFTWSGREAAASCTEFAKALLVHISYTYPFYPDALFGEMHCRVLDPTGRPLQFMGLHPAFFSSLVSGHTTERLGLVFSKRDGGPARARVIVTTDEGEFEMKYEPAQRTSDPADGLPAAGDAEGREER